VCGGPQADPRCRGCRSMSSAAINLQSGFSLGTLTLPNRIVMAPMTRYMSPGYIPPAAAAEYYARRVRGGAGLVITEATIVDEPHATAYEDVPGMYGAPAAEGWRAVVDAVHAAGGRIFSQLWHTGAIRKPGVGPQPDLPAISPSGLLLDGVPSGRAMTRSDIDRVIDAFARGAQLAASLGFDGIEIHGAHGYLVDQFLWAGTNRRTDGYGGDITSRSRFAAELVAAVRAAIGPAVPISFRFSQWKQQDYSARLAESPAQLAAILQPLVDAGVDVFHASTRRFWEPEFPDSGLNLAGWTKALTGKPVITVGSICLDTEFLASDGEYEALMQDFDESRAAGQEELLAGVGKLMSAHSGVGGLHGLVERLAAEEFDLVAIGRALIANPDLPQLLQQERWDQIQPYDAAMLTALT
jgi:2,4-dienoyl-CoA reductase-like NADH-dependent reductase (Old Yellow Enzyme family)